MSLRSDSYGSVAEVVTMVRYLMKGRPTFSSETTPTLTEVEKFIDRASASLNIALNNHGFTTPVTNSTAKLLCDEWVVMNAAGYVEITQQGSSYGGSPGTRANSLLSLHDKADEFVGGNLLGLTRVGVGVSHKLSDGLAFTGMDDQDQRDDPDDSDLEQPMFKRGQFDAYSTDVEDEDED